MKLGEVKAVVNKQRNFGANLEYLVVHVKKDGKVIPLMLTPEDFRAFKVRAEKNPEDVPALKLNVFQKIARLCQ